MTARKCQKLSRLLARLWVIICHVGSLSVVIFRHTLHYHFQILISSCVRNFGYVFCLSYFSGLIQIAVVFVFSCLWKMNDSIKYADNGKK